MPMDAGAVGIRPVTQDRLTGRTDSVQRRDDGSSASSFKPQTNVALKTAIDDLAGTLSKISAQERFGFDKMPTEVRDIVKNILQQSFSMQETLAQGVGSTIESQRFSMEQLSVFARMLSQIGALADKGFSMELSDETQTLLTQFKNLLVSSEGGSSLEPVLMSKAAFELIDSKTAEQLPQALYEILSQLAAQMQTMPTNQTQQSEGMQFLKQLIQYFMPRPSQNTQQTQQQPQTQQQQNQQAKQSPTQRFLSSMFRQYAENAQLSSRQPPQPPTQQAQQQPTAQQNQPNQTQQPFQQNQPNQTQQPFQQNQPNQTQQPFQQNQPNQTQQPFQQNQPNQTQQPFQQNQPNQTQQPFQQNQPNQTQQPFQQNQPNQTQQPFQQNQPNQTQQPFQQNQPNQTQQPFQQNQPNQTQQPFQQNQPTQTQQPFQQNQPNQTQQPFQQNQPNQTQQPFQQNQPNQTQQPFQQNQPNQTQQPFQQNQPNQTQQPFQQNQPNQTQQPFQQNQPNQTQQPFQQNQPNQTQQPFQQNQPNQAQQPFQQNQPNQAQQPFQQNQPNQTQQSFQQNQPNQTQQPFQQNQPNQTQQPFQQNQPNQTQQPFQQNQPNQTQQPFQQSSADDFLSKQAAFREQMQIAKTTLLKQPMKNDSQTMDTMKNLAQMLMKNTEMSPRSTVLLQNFINNSQTMMPEAEARHLQNLLRLCQQNVPVTVQQAAVQQNLPDLPRLWAFMQLCDMAGLTSKMTARAFKRAGKDVAEFANGMRQAMGGDNSTSNVQTQRSFQMMVPLYLGDNDHSYPTYLSVYDENEKDKETGANKKETWVRICILTDNIGAVELTFRVYEENRLDMRFYFSQRETASEFRQYMDDLRDTINETDLNVAEIRIGSVGEKMKAS